MPRPDPSVIDDHSGRLLVALRELDGPAATLGLAVHAAGLSADEGRVAYAELVAAGLVRPDRETPP